MRKNIYKLGARKEYDIIYKARKEGFLAFRSAGSHSPIDIVIIDKKTRKIWLVQSKRTLDKSMSYVDEKMKIEIEAENQDFNGAFEVKFEVR